MVTDPGHPPVRAFFALWPEAPVARAMADVTERLGVSGRRVAAGRLHVTLAFLGDVPRERLPLLEAIGAGLPRPAITLCLDRVGHWRRARVTWLAPSVVPSGLSALHGRLRAVLGEAGLRTERRPFTPHVTLARKGRPLRTTAIDPVVWPLTRVALVGSQSGDSGSRYQVIADWPLTPSGAAAGPDGGGVSAADNMK